MYNNVQEMRISTSIGISNISNRFSIRFLSPIKTKSQYVAQVSFEVLDSSDPPASVSQVLGLKEYMTLRGLINALLIYKNELYD